MDKTYKTLGRPQFVRKRHPKHLESKDAQYQIDIACSEQTLESMQYANARVFIDQLFPTQTARDDIRKEVGKVAESILIGMRSMIDQISWMSQKSKQGAYYKIDNLVKNIAYPDFIYDDNALNQYYSALKFSTSGTTVQDYVTLLNDLTRFSYWTSYNYTTFKDIKRDDFNGAPGVVNAWYQVLDLLLPPLPTNNP
jgi:predicted metalloendopeptidase